VFRTIFADIGDEQSIEANLSTFSWHVTNIAGMDRGLDLPALVLLDEVGAGTDPGRWRRARHGGHRPLPAARAHLVATTHFDTLKTYASTTPGVACAAFGFAPDSFEPTYRLLYGSPAAAWRSRLPQDSAGPGIIDAARHYRSEREAQLGAPREGRPGAPCARHERRLVVRERGALAEQRCDPRRARTRCGQREEQARKRFETQFEERCVTRGARSTGSSTS